MSKIGERLEKLETLNDHMRKPNLALEDALALFEEGIKLSRSLEKDLEKIEGKIEILKNAEDLQISKKESEIKPELDLFSTEGAQD